MHALCDSCLSFFSKVLVGLVAQIDATMRTSAPADYKGVQAKEQIVKGELYKVLKSVELVEKVFPIIKAQKEY